MRVCAIALTALLSCASVALAEEAPPPNATPQQPASPPQSGPASGDPAAAKEPDRADPAPIAPDTQQTKNDKLPVRTPSAGSARFNLQRVDDGFLRFDTLTGKIAFCSPRHKGWGCEAVPEEPAAMEEEVRQLRGEVADLKHQIETLREPPPPRPPGSIPSQPAPQPPKASGSGDMTFSLPAREDVARAGAALQDYWRQFVDMIIGFKNDVLRKS
jgi:hypothetical protein